jgi:hypothetical protein
MTCMVFFAFNDLRWEVAVRFVDIGGTVDYHSQWLRAKGFHKSVVAKCQHPKDLKGKSIFSIDPENFKCGMFS